VILGPRAQFGGNLRPLDRILKWWNYDVVIRPAKAIINHSRRFNNFSNRPDLKQRKVQRYASAGCSASTSMALCHAPTGSPEQT
jgi:hypothetical protein